MEFGNWRKITSQEGANRLLAHVENFRDAILRESKYSQGSYIDENCALMICRKPHLRCLFQRQKRAPEVVEMFFVNVNSIGLCSMPHDTIEEATIRVSEDRLVWRDRGEGHLEEGSVICCDFAYWREIQGWLGPRERYTAVLPEDLEYYAPEEDCEMADPSARGPGRAL